LRIVVFGAGAVGGFLGAELALAGFDVTLIARGANLAAMRTRGVTVLRDGQARTAKPRCTDDPAEAGSQDYVVMAVKAPDAPTAAAAIGPLLRPEPAVVMAMNGIPWWYFHGLDGPLDDLRIDSVDPGGVQWSAIGPQRAIGCVVYPATEVTEPGVIRHIQGDEFVLGEPSGEQSERVLALSRAIGTARLRAPVRPNIRDEIWLKLWGNVAFNPLSALTGATLVQICATPGTRALARQIMVEVQALAEALDVRFPIDVDRRIEGAAAVGAHKTSMLQDLERGRPLEIEPVVGVVAELGRRVGVATPTLDAILALIRLRAATAA